METPSSANEHSCALRKKAGKPHAWVTYRHCNSGLLSCQVDPIQWVCYLCDYITKHTPPVCSAPGTCIFAAVLAVSAILVRLLRGSRECSFASKLLWFHACGRFTVSVCSCRYPSPRTRLCTRSRRPPHSGKDTRRERSCIPCAYGIALRMHSHECNGSDAHAYVAL